MAKRGAFRGGAQQQKRTQMGRPSREFSPVGQIAVITLCFWPNECPLARWLDLCSDFNYANSALGKIALDPFRPPPIQFALNGFSKIAAAVATLLSLFHHHQDCPNSNKYNWAARAQTFTKNVRQAVKPNLRFTAFFIWMSPSPPGFVCIWRFWRL